MISDGVYTKSVKNLAGIVINYGSNGGFTWILLV